jgi:hypothetical protein
LIVTGFDGREKKWRLPKKSKAKRGRQSKLHKRTRLILRDLFRRDIILEEVSLPGSNTTTRPSILFADFFIPSRNLIVEVHGRQHYEFVDFYHKTKSGFYKSQARDRDKMRWCRLNKIDIVTLKYTGDDDEWKTEIRDR